MGELKAADGSHLSEKCGQRSHDVMLDHVLTHLLTTARTQVPVGQTDATGSLAGRVRGLGQVLTLQKYKLCFHCTMFVAPLVVVTETCLHEKPTAMTCFSSNPNDRKHHLYI